MIIKEKYCKKCDTHKSLTEFGKDSKRKDGLCDYCKKCWAERSKHYRRVMPEKTQESAKRSYDKNRDKYNAQKREYREANKEYFNAKTREYKKQNKGLINSSNARRRASKMKATPSWANKFIIDEIYSLAQLRTEMLGIEFHVDHEIPLTHNLVCGLHNEFNLKIVTASENLTKHNSFEV